MNLIKFKINNKTLFLNLEEWEKEREFFKRKSMTQEEKEQIIKELSIGRGYLQDWYQASIDETKPPVWTDEHLDELFADFYLIPKNNGTEK